MNYAAIDLSSLSWVLPELDRTFTTVRHHLFNAHDVSLQFSADIITHLTAAKHSIHDAAGALQIIDAQGLVHYVMCIEQAIDYHIDKEILEQSSYVTLDEACYALIAYLNELQIQQLPLQPTCLFGYYESVRLLLIVTGITVAPTVHPVDLYFPNLGIRLKRTHHKNDTLGSHRPINYAKLRTVYEKLMLQVLTDKANQKEFDSLSLLMLLLANHSTHTYEHSFWKSCEVVFLIFLRIPTANRTLIKRWIARLNMHLHSLMMNASHVSERLFREALYFIAIDIEVVTGGVYQSAPLTLTDYAHSLYKDIVEAYSLSQSTVLDIHSKRYGVAPPINTIELVNLLGVLKMAWDESFPASVESEGIQIALTTLHRRFSIAIQYTIDLRDKLNQYRLTTLAYVVDSIIQASNTFKDTQQPLSKAFGLEGAQAILWLEDVLKKTGQTQATLNKKSQELSQRILLSVNTEESVSVATFNDMISEQLLMSGVVREILVNLSAIEKDLESIFKVALNTGIFNNIAPIMQSLAQVDSTLGLLTLPAIEQAFKAIYARLSLLVSQNQKPTQDEILAFALRFSQMTNLLDVFIRSSIRAQQTFIFDNQTEQIVELKNPSYNHSHEEIVIHRQTIIDNNIDNNIDNIDIIDIIDNSKDTNNLSEDTANNIPIDIVINIKNYIDNDEGNDKNINTDNSINNVDNISNVDNIDSIDNVDNINNLINNKNINNDINELYTIFTEEAHNILINIRNALNSLEQITNKTLAINNIRRDIHTLTGSARTVGFKSFGDAAYLVETVIDDFLTQQNTVGSASEIALVNAIRYAQELLSIWLEELNACLFTFGQPVSKHTGGIAPVLSFDVTSCLEHFTTSLTPYLNTIKNDAACVHHFDTQDEETHSSNFIEAARKAVLHARTIERESLILDNDIDHSRDFIEAARKAVLHARTIDRKPFTLNDELLLLQPVKILTSDSINKNNPDSILMVNIGPLRLSKQLFLLYIQETEHYLNALRIELNDYEQKINQGLVNILTDTQSPIEFSLLEAYRYAHSIKGSSATIGLLALRDLITPVEALLHHAYYNHLELIPQDVYCLLSAISDMTQDLILFSCEKYPNIRQSTLDTLNQLLLDFTHIPRIIRHFSHSNVLNILSSTSQNLNTVTENKATDSKATDNFKEYSSTELELNEPFISLDNYTDDTNDTCPIFDIDEEQRHVDNIDADIWQDLLEETETLMPNAQAALNAAALHSEALSATRRDLHTLKGCFRMAGAMYLGAMVHALESKLDHHVQAEPPFLRQEIHAELIDHYDAITLHFERLKQPIVLPDIATNSKLTYGLSPTPLDTQLNKLAITSSPASIVQTDTGKVSTLRMRTDTLDNLVNQATEVSSAKGRLDQHVLHLRGSLLDLTDNVERLRKQLRELEIQGDSQMAARVDLTLINASKFDPLEFDRFTRFQELTRMLTESLNDLLAVRDAVSKTLTEIERDLTQQTKSTKEMTRSLMHSRLIAFDTIADRLYRVVRQSAKELEKQVRLDLVGGTLMLDRFILEQISGSLEHLIRNSVAHGIELPEDRSKLQKPIQGTITVKIIQQGNELEITLEDDGAGLNLTKIHQLAIEKGLINPNIVPVAAQLADLIFMPGFTTVQNITELSGRGIGMDVVRSDIVGLGGRIALHTIVQKGTKFTLRVPLTLAISQVLMVVAHQVLYAVPSALIQKVISLKFTELTQAYQQGFLQVDNVNYSFAHLTQLMGEKMNTLPQATALVLLLSNGNATAAVHIDSIQSNVEAVVKPLSPLMRRTPGLISATLLSDGKLCLIVDPIQLLQAYIHTALINTPPIQASGNQLAVSAHELIAITDPLTHNTDTIISKNASTRLVMVVDDSLTVRKVTQKLLLREGWEVLLAKDGIDALEQLQTVQPTLMIVDIEMPRMDGFDLARNIRAETRLMHMPIIMITSRIADKHREYAMGLGVNIYMGKPYHDEVLLAAMAELTL